NAEPGRNFCGCLWRLSEQPLRTSLWPARTPLPEMISESARLVFERLSFSDALYHDAEHTAFVAMVGQDILRGVRLKRDVSPEDWLHMTLATLTHDIGYVRGVCHNDRNGHYVMNDGGETF